MPTPHVHAELIKAWAVGAEIEVWETGGRWQHTLNPMWQDYSKYRIKPTPKAKIKRWLWAFKFSQDVCWKSTTAFLTESEFKTYTAAKGFPLLWSETEFEE